MSGSFMWYYRARSNCQCSWKTDGYGKMKLNASLPQSLQYLGIRCEGANGMPKDPKCETNAKDGKGGGTYPVQHWGSANLVVMGWAGKVHSVLHLCSTFAPSQQ